MLAWLRSHWPKLVSGLAIAAVAGVAGVVSYLHIFELTLTLHQPALVARLMPLAVDGLVVAGSVVLLQAGGWLGWVAVGPGVAISLFANVESGIRYGILPAAWAGVPAVAFFASTFVLERWASSQAGSTRHVAGTVDAGTAPASSAMPELVPAAVNGHGTVWAAARPAGWS